MVQAHESDMQIHLFPPNKRKFWKGDAKRDRVMRRKMEAPLKLGGLEELTEVKEKLRILCSERGGNALPG
jgi:hypothetical protein